MIKTENASCKGESYILETVLSEGKYSYGIYKTSYSAGNLIVSLKSPVNGKALSLLSVPKENCSKLYLTAYIPETDSPAGGMFEWKIGETTIEELAISSDFSSVFTPFYTDGNWNRSISPDGERIVIAQPSETSDNEESELYCYYQKLVLLDLSQDTSKLLVELPKSEGLDRGSSLTGNCVGISVGWINSSTVYYDVFGVDQGRSLIERRTISI